MQVNVEMCSFNDFKLKSESAASFSSFLSALQPLSLFGCRLTLVIAFSSGISPSTYTHQTLVIHLVPLDVYWCSIDSYCAKVLLTFTFVNPQLTWRLFETTHTNSHLHHGPLGLCKASIPFLFPFTPPFGLNRLRCVA